MAPAGAVVRNDGWGEVRTMVVDSLGTMGHPFLQWKAETTSPKPRHTGSILDIIHEIIYLWSYLQLPLITCYILWLAAKLLLYSRRVSSTGLTEGRLLS